MRQHRPCLCIILLVATLLLGGCADFRGMGVFTEQGRYLAKATQSLRAGSNEQARKLLEQVILTKATVGITDEALFRLSLLNLNNETVKVSMRTLALLERLKKEYPNSPWTHQSAPLLSYLSGVRVFHEKEREQNIFLQRENRELRQSIERLKELDLEMDKKNKR